MSTSSDIRAAWRTNILDDATVASWTTRRYNEEPLSENSNDIGDFLSAVAGDRTPYVNYIHIVATRQELESGATNRIHEYVHTVNLTYTLEKLINGGNSHSTLVDRMNVMHELVWTALDTTWAGTLNGYFSNIDISGDPQTVLIGGRECWRMTNTYEGRDKVII